MSKNNDGQLSRRKFIASSIAGAFVLTSGFDSAKEVFGKTASTDVFDSVAVRREPMISELGTWLRIGSDESVTILVGSSEMGQGILTGLAQLVAEDLMVDWSQVTVQSAPANSIYGNPLYRSQMTVGSGSIRGYYKALRVAGATAREMLIAAAAQTWGIPAAACTAANGQISNSQNNSILKYGQLATLAALMPVPTNPSLVPDGSLRYIGASMKRVDIPQKVNGSAVYGIDVRIPDMVYAVVKHCPTFGGTLNKTPAVPSGAIAVIPLKVMSGTGRGTETTGMINAVAVVASNTWSALQGANRVQAVWDIPATSLQLNTDDFYAQAESYLEKGAPDTRIAETIGPIVKQRSASKTVSATYYLPYQAHAPMEVLNATVRISGVGADRRCEIWAPTQSQSACVATAQTLTGLPASQIDVTTTYLGGGLGRKFEQDFISQAIQVALAINRPVKFMWSREEDYSRDQYRPMAVVRIDASFDRLRNVSSWDYRNCSPSIALQRRPTSTSIDAQAVEGSTTATGVTYSFLTRSVKHLVHPSTIPVGYWRSVGYSINTFAVESMMDELAAAANIDPLEFRRQHLASSPRALAVLNKAASIAKWSAAPTNGRAKGLALLQGFGSMVAVVVEISAPTPTSIRLQNVWCAVDCGRAINPESVKSQIEGGLVHGINAALWEQVKFTAGKSSVRNFNNTRKIRLSEMPAITVELMPTDPTAPIGGLGEPGVPAIAPAIANAYFRLTGTRVRKLPFFPK